MENEKPTQNSLKLEDRETRLNLTPDLQKNKGII
jgi:hypothetical protein